MEATCHLIYKFLSLGGYKIVSCCNSICGIRRSKAIINIHMFTTGASEIQIVYCGLYSLGDMRIRLSISEMSMRIVPLQDLQALTSESGNNFLFNFDIRRRGVFSFKPPAYLSHMKKVWFPFDTWLSGPQDIYRPFAKGI